MAIRDFQELVCWQLSHTLKCEVFDFTAMGGAARDFDYRDQIRDSSASAPANISEAFGRLSAADSARILGIAHASLQETRNHLIDGHDRRYLDDRLYWRLMNLAWAALNATKNYIRTKQRQAEEDGRRRLRPNVPRSRDNG